MGMGKVKGMGGAARHGCRQELLLPTPAEITHHPYLASGNPAGRCWHSAVTRWVVRAVKAVRVVTSLVPWDRYRYYEYSNPKVLQDAPCQVGWWYIRSTVLVPWLG